VRTRSVLARGCALVAIVGWSASAEAFQGYPLVVDKWLGTSGLIEKIEPPTGCQLCHVSDQGGTVDLRPFGDLLVETYGIQRTAEEDTVLAAALDGLQSANPTLFADIQHGMDPNTDPALTAHELPQPEYGCSLGAPRPRNEEPWSGWFVALVLAAWAARMGRARSRQQ
jgi:hypothetical protein